MVYYASIKEADECSRCSVIQRCLSTFTLESRPTGNNTPDYTFVTYTNGTSTVHEYMFGNFFISDLIPGKYFSNIRR